MRARWRNTLLVALVSLASSPLLALPASAAPVDPDGGDVVAERVDADGTIRVTIWTPAPGVSATTLYRELKAHNTVGLRDPASRGRRLAEPVDCNIQGAYAWARQCGTQQYHWSGTHPTIYFHDYTNSQWPVYEAAVVWNQSTALNVGYASRTASCPAGLPCVSVQQGGFNDDCAGTTKWVGCTKLGLDATTRLITTAAVRLNDLYASTYARNQMPVCHELGHALGLDHNLFKTSCMYGAADADVARTPHTGDFLMLESIY
jgi:hypothetical protein